MNYLTPYEAVCAKCAQIPLSPFANCICKYPKYSYALNRCEGCLREERRRLQAVYRDFVYQHAELSTEVKDELWRWINSLSYPAIVSGVNML
jgi:hypothetical protein